MKTAESVCRELKALDGVVGAFVLQQNRCIASSLPPQYDPNRLVQVGATLARVSQISQKAGYEQSATAFHWQRASLLTWPLGREGLLGLLAAPTAVREAVNLSAAMAIEDLAGTDDANQEAFRQASPAVAVVPRPTPVTEQNESSVNARIREVEQLLMEELGPSGRSLFERCQAKTPRGTLSPSQWLLALRSTILADIADPGARVTIATSHFWVLTD